MAFTKNGEVIHLSVFMVDVEQRVSLPDANDLPEQSAHAELAYRVVPGSQTSAKKLGKTFAAVF